MIPNILISRSDAVLTGQKRYFTGQACKHGHIAPRRVHNGTCVECVETVHAAWVKKNPDRAAASIRDWHRRKKGIYPTRPEPETCEACHQSEPQDRTLASDHDHLTGEFRGWLCSECNTALGLLREEPARFDALKRYLEVARVSALN